MSTLTTHIPGMHRNSAFTPGRIFAWAVLAVMLGITLTPLWVVIKTALTHPTDLFTHSRSPL